MPSSRPHPNAKEEASTPIPGHIYARYGVFPSSGEISFQVAKDKLDGLGRPGRTGMICNGSNTDFMTFQISPDGQNFSNDIYLPAFGVGFPNYVQFGFDDGVFIDTIRLIGSANEPYGLVIAPGRDPEGFIPQLVAVPGEPGPQRKITKGGSL